MKIALTTLAAIGATALIALMYTQAARSGEPIGGTSSQICDSQGNCETHATVECRKPAWPWGLSCWSKKEGAAFARWLRAHGASPWTFRKRHPELARSFGAEWPGVNWQVLERSFPKAVAHAAQRFGVSASWLTSCAASEGGTTPGYIAVGSAGEQGWWQYLGGTWDFMSRSAFTYKGSPPPAYRRITSLVGQAWTTAWAFSQGLSYHWHGRGCS